MRKIYIISILLIIFSLACGPVVDSGADGGASSAAADAAENSGTDSGTASGTDSGSSSIAEGDFINGDFEQGSGVGWSEYPGPLIFPAANFGEPAYSGNWVARMGPMGDSEVIVMQQAVRLSASATTMAFATYIYSEELCDVPWYDNMSLRINDTIIEENGRLCNYDNTDDWLYSTMDISPWAGQTVTVTFRLSTVSGDALASTIYIDKVSIY